jgi:putative transposase
MTIVPIGKQMLQVLEGAENRESFMEQLNRELVRVVRKVVSQSIEAVLEEEVTQVLGRQLYVRRKHSGAPESARARCNGCKSRAVQEFRRNGHRKRGLDTRWGHLELQVPQVECQCGHAVRVQYQTMERRQRIWDDLTVEIRAEYGRGMSLRCIKDELDGLLGGSIGLRTLNQRVLEIEKYVGGWQKQALEAIPPVIRVDGLWVTIMVGQAEKRRDGLGRLRTVKQAKRIPVLMAQGVWPESGKQTILTWCLGSGEDKFSWEDLLFQLRAKGVKADQLALLIGDGSSGFEAARQSVYPEVPFQRCIFHKIRHVLRALTCPPGMDRPTLGEYKRPILESLSQIWQAETEIEARQRQRAFCQRWEKEQAAAVTTLQRDFELTLTFYQVRCEAADRGQVWPVTLLRTTSQLERENRGFRKRIREAVIFHSPSGLTASLYQNQVLRQALSVVGIPGDWVVKIERQIAESHYFLNP